MKEKRMQAQGYGDDFLFLKSPAACWAFAFIILLLLFAGRYDHIELQEN